MENDNTIRWIQRFGNYKKALQKLIEVVDSGKRSKDLSELEKEGLVQRFEYTFELAWKTLQDLLIFRGYNVIPEPNSILKKSLEDALISDHDGWRKMMQARNSTTHTYDEENAAKIVEQIYATYASLLRELRKELERFIC